MHFWVACEFIKSETDGARRSLVANHTVGIARLQRTVGRGLEKMTNINVEIYREWQSANVT